MTEVVLLSGKMILLCIKMISLGGKMFLGDGFCDDQANIYQCEFDGGDCCGEINDLNCLQCMCLGKTLLLIIKLPGIFQGILYSDHHIYNNLLHYNHRDNSS